MDRAVVDHEDDGLVRAARARPVDRVEAAEELDDVAGFGLLLRQMQAQPAAIDRVGVLPPLQAVPRPTPGNPPPLWNGPPLSSTMFG
jgi:hypothetical protein